MVAEVVTDYSQLNAPRLDIDERIARFDRGPVELRLFDENDRLIAAYIDMKAMQDELDLARDRELGE